MQNPQQPERPFFQPKLTGARFNDAKMPLDIFKDLAALEELIVEMAKEEWRRENPGRKKLPDNFGKDVGLELDHVDPGSAKPFLRLVFLAVGLFGTVNSRFYERARDRIVSAVSAISEGRDPRENLPEFALEYFERIGKGLQEGEAIEFRPGAPQPAPLTQNVRDRLIYASNRNREQHQDVVLRGNIPSVDQGASNSFTIATIAGGKYEGPLSPDYLEIILEATKNYKDNQRVEIEGVGVFDRGNKLVRINSIRTVAMLENRDIGARLDEFKTYKRNWLDGSGEPFNREALDWLNLQFDTYYPNGVALPYLYPTEQGNVRAEWTNGETEASLEINLAYKSGYWHILNLETDEDEEETFDLNTPEGWQASMQLVTNVLLQA